MKRIVVAFFLSLIIFSFAGCIKGSHACVAKTPDSEKAAILTYASANGLSVTADPSGLYFQIVNPGGSGGAIPFPTSKVFVTYTGKFITSNVIFDSQTNSTLTGWILNTLIPGWQIGLQLIHKGGTIRLLIPSSLAYGCTGAGSIPPDTVLFFEITLVDVM